MLLQFHRIYHRASSFHKIQAEILYEKSERRKLMPVRKKAEVYSTVQGFLTKLTGSRRSRKLRDLP